MDENMNNYILILGGKHFGINNSLAPARNRVKKSLDEGVRDLLPFFLQLGELFIRIPCNSSYKTTLQLGPYPLDNVKVCGLAWPVEEGHITAGEPVVNVLGSLFRIIILLENEATTNRIACIRTHGVFKDVFKLKLIHDSLNLPQGTRAKARDASRNHDISNPMLHCWNLVLGVETSALGTTIHCISSVPNNMYLLSSLQRTSSHSFLVQSLCAFAHSTRALRFFVEIIGFLTGRLPFSPAA
ncbi:hypothetical protein AVEN_245802-1 [Araneus ventricosus]|uniref:Uncharacterized protein n=1 Tax=Araneus ventricosus TaxID=182803 RepID=A0A4Y2LCQ5_ARAVE|nr:hypothetical protein AVEN_245802-1 [Araneus ventricosus]